MELLLKLATVFCLATFELWAAIPAGLALKLDPVTTGVAASAGAITGMFLAALLGERARAWHLKRKGLGSERSGGRLQKIWERYGVAGLGLLAPLITGAPLGVVIGLAMKAPYKPLVMWMSVGIVLWGAVLTALAALGAEWIMSFAI